MGATRPGSLHHEPSSFLAREVCVVILSHPGCCQRVLKLVEGRDERSAQVPCLGRCVGVGLEEHPPDPRADPGAFMSTSGLGRAGVPQPRQGPRTLKNSNQRKDDRSKSPSPLGRPGERREMDAGRTQAEKRTGAWSAQAAGQLPSPAAWP